MNATEIHRAISPLIEFAPALMQLKAIVEAAEKAEEKLAGYQKEFADSEARIAEMKKQEDKNRQAMSDAKVAFNKTKADFDAQTKELADGLARAREENKGLDAQLKKAITARKGELKQAAREVEAAKVELDGVKAEITALKKKFAA